MTYQQEGERKNNSISHIFLFQMYLSYLILLFTFHLTSSSICTENDSFSSCECEEISSAGQITLALKCTNLPRLKSHLHYQTIELDSCSEPIDFSQQSFNEMTVNILRIRHCHLIHLNEQTFVNIQQLEKFYLENATIHSQGKFQEIFSAKSFQTLKSLSLRTVHLQDEQLQLEYLLQQLPRLNRLEISHVHLENSSPSPQQNIGQDLTYLSLTNTHQTHLIPIQSFPLLESLLIRHLPQVFHTQPLISSLIKLKHLKYILFEHNQLKSIDDLRSNSIDDIDLSSNFIESIPEYTFEHVPRLRQLTLTGNALKFIDQNAFCGVVHLQRLSIHNKHRLISPLDNCLLIHYPHLQIIQDSQMKFACNCQLNEVFQLKRQQTREINRLFKMNHVCLDESRTINLYELGSMFNCSSKTSCPRLCQGRATMKSSSNIHVHSIDSKDSSAMMINFNLSYVLIFLLLLCSSYL